MYISQAERTGFQPINVFENEAWLEYSEQKLNNFVRQSLDASLTAPQALGFPLKYSDAIANLHTPPESLKVLDFGGGVGHLFPLFRYTMNNVRADINIDYTIVDGAPSCKRGQELFSGQRRPSPPIYYEQHDVSVANISLHSDCIEFRTSLEGYEKSIDVFISTITLYYLTDLSKLFALIEEKKPKLIFFSYFLANTIGEKINLAQVFTDQSAKIFPDRNAYLDVTAHSMEHIVATLTDSGYVQIPGVEYDKGTGKEFSESLRNQHPGVKMIDLFFSLKEST